MEYSSLMELYHALIPAFNVKKRLLSIFKNVNLTNEDIWKYLATTKWQNVVNLTLSEMVNDIITADIYHIIKFKGGK